MKVLIVHDSEERTLEIKAVFEKMEKHFEVQCVTNASEARDQLSSKNFDLLILDLHIPENRRSVARPENGFNLLIEAGSSPRLLSPKHIWGITSQSDLHVKYRAQFEENSHSLINTDEDWKKILNNKINYILKTSSQSPLLPIVEKIDICILTALEEEIIPYRKKLPLQEMTVPGDPITYFKTEIKNGDKVYSVVICTLDTMGIGPTSILATKAIYNFSPDLICITGICAGLHEDLKLGDIIITEKSFDYSMGKIKDMKDSDKIEFKPNNFPHNISVKLKQALIKIKSNEELIDNAMEGIVLDEDLKTTRPSLFVGPTSTGPFVVESKIVTNLIKNLERKVLGLDMETYALFNTVYYFDSISRPEVLSIKSVCDMADVEKDDRFHSFCSEVSANYLITFLQNSVFKTLKKN